MQFIKCTREALLKPLQTVGGIVEGRQTLPILANVLIQKEKDKVSFTTTDLEIQIRTTADVGTGDEDCKTSLPPLCPVRQLKLLSTQKNARWCSLQPIRVSRFLSCPLRTIPSSTPPK